MRLSGLHLRCANPATLGGFYGDMLGMRALGDGRFGYAGEDADLVLHPGGGGYTHDPGQRYWKIGITLTNLDHAVRVLWDKGVDVSDPKQFLDIGYMAHLSDPEGFAIELLQWDFEGNRASDAGDPEAPFAEARIGQITLRSGDVQADTVYWKDLGMRLLSLQDVSAYGFDLHFLAFTDDHPPLPDLWSAGNREWLWRRPYTVLEFQHVENAVFAPVPDLLGIEVAGLERDGTDPSGIPVLPG
ncbi:VOC family protein [Ruegeria hyattellae]|uniref:VOC family protein n=1 Tax=Ruegeria hyattellae TaxID=3233337 RepID=UPI00355C1AE4